MVSWMFCLVAFVIGCLPAQGQNAVEIQYLGSASRINSPSTTDYYLTCRATGSNLLWTVDSQPSISFNSGDNINTRFSGTTGRFQYVVLLLSFELHGSTNASFISFLIVSDNTMPADLFSVSCSNIVNSDIIPSVVSSPVREAADVSVNGAMQFLFVTNITDMQTTYFYICGVNDTILRWQTTNVAPLSVLSSDARGRRILSSDNEDFGFLLSTTPYPVVALYVMKRNPPTDVTCFSQNSFSDTVTIADVKKMIMSVPTTSPPMTPGKTTTIDTTTTSEVIETTSPTPSRIKPWMIALIVVAVIVVVVVVVIVAMVLIGIKIYRIYRELKEIKGGAKPKPKDEAEEKFEDRSNYSDKDKSS